MERAEFARKSDLIADRKIGVHALRYSLKQSVPQLSTPVLIERRQRDASTRRST